MLGAGVPGGIYPAFKPFSYQEIERFIALYILQGLNPSPQVEMKFNSQETDLSKEMIFVTVFLHVMQYDVTSSLRHSSVSKTQ